MRFAKQASPSPSAEDIEHLVATSVEAHLVDLIPRLRAEAEAAARSALPDWLRWIPILSRRELAIEFVKKSCDGLSASVDEETEIATFYRDGARVPFPIAFVRNLVTGRQPRLEYDVFEGALRAGRATLINALSPPADEEKWQSFELAVGRALVDMGRGKEV